MKYLPSFDYFIARGRAYKLMLCVFWLCLSIIVYLCIRPISFWIIDDLAPKLPIGETLRIPILVKINTTDYPQINALQSPQKVLAYQTTPRLELVGVGTKVIQETATTSSAIELGIFPKFKNHIFKTDTTADFYYDSPSLLLLIQELMYSPKGMPLRRKLTHLKTQFMEGWQAIWPTVKHHLSKHLTSDELQLIIRDPVIHNAIKVGLVNDISQMVSLEHLEQTIFNIPEVKHLISIATHKINTSRLAEHALRGLYSGGKTEFKETNKLIGQLWNDNVLFQDSAHCIGFIFGQSFTWGGQLLSRFLQDKNSKLCGQIKTSINQTMVSALSQSGKDFASQAWNNVYEQRQVALKLGSQATKSVIKELKVVPVLKRFWAGVQQDKTLHNYVIKKYGNDTWQRLKKALAHIAESSVLHRELKRLATHLEQFTHTLLTAIILDSSSQGPNPLLITIIQEQLTNVKRPVIWITPGHSNQVVGEGHLLQSPAWKRR